MQSKEKHLTSPTFAEATEAAGELRGRRYTSQGAEHWRRPLEIHAYPHLRDLRVDVIEPGHIIGVLRQLDAQYPRSVPRVCQRIRFVMSWAVACGHRRDNPCDAARAAFPPSPRPETRPHPALPPAKVPEAVAQVRNAPYWVGARLLFEFLVLTVVRSDAARGALWSEIDLEAAMWTVPAQRMTNRRKHRVPLSSAVRALLREGRDDAGLREARSRGGCADLVFPSVRGQPLSGSALSTMLRQLHIGAVPYGFRHSFAEWAADTTVDFTIAGACLSWADRRSICVSFCPSDFYSHRVTVMEQWGRHVAPDR